MHLWLYAELDLYDVKFPADQEVLRGFHCFKSADTGKHRLLS